MKAYPGRAKKFEPVLYPVWSAKSLPRDIQLGPHPDHQLYHGKRGRANQFPGYQDYLEQEAVYGYQEWTRRKEDILEALGEETSDIFQVAFQRSSPSKKSKQSSIRLSKERLAEVHQPTRSCSVDSRKQPALSRRQILASLEEEITVQENPSSSPILSSISACSWSSSSPFSSPSSTPSPPTSEYSFSSLLGVSEGVFSRACLLQSISREESASPGFPGGGRATLDSSGETIDSDRYDSNSNSEASEDDDDSHLLELHTWEEDAKSFLSDPSGTSHLRPDSNCDCDGEDFTPHEVSLEDLTWVATLGVGGFGRVELVTAGGNKIPFALKKMKKNEIQDQKQRQHILNEKSVMKSCVSPFIVQLYQTYQDSKYLYMLMEPCLGGELWTILRNSKRFTDSTARFYVACVILAFDYLHDKGVIYRDLKPENLLLDSSGYIKLTDFGFAKQLAAEEKAWTFCGTPEYVAPEIITNKSHDHRADIWSIGILVFELLTGAPPFTNKANPAQVYPEILKGIRGVFFPSFISASASEIIRQCCRLSPTQRPSLNILKHYIWFAGLDWVRLADRSLPPPSVPTIASTRDASNFDSFKIDQDDPEEDFSDWATNF